MPKLKSKKKALEMIIKIGDEIMQLCEERGVNEITIGRGELRSMLNTGIRRGKDLLTMAIRNFMVDERIITCRWELEVRDWEKPIIHLRRRTT